MAFSPSRLLGFSLLVVSSGRSGPAVVLRAKFDIKGHFGLRWD